LSRIHSSHVSSDEPRGFQSIAFLGAGAVIHAIGTRNMYQMGGLKKEMKLSLYHHAHGGLSLAGLIPLSGFWSKGYDSTSINTFLLLTVSFQ